MFVFVSEECLLVDCSVLSVDSISGGAVELLLVDVDRMELLSGSEFEED